MNLADGKIIDTKSCDAILETLDERILSTLNKKRLDPEIVIAACSRLVRDLDESYYLETMAGLGINKDLGQSYLDEARLMFDGDSLRARLTIEFGENYGQPKIFTPQGKASPVTECTVPLGVLLHVAAGNADGLPAFSVLEGLLAGNINILKLPAVEGGLSVRLLLELIKIEPRLTEYIYVFDYSSRDIEHIARLISIADAVVVWGGIEAVSAFRKMVDPSTRLIEWGHKVSFAYVTGQGITDEALAGLAHNIVTTGQLLCSSCQGIYVDTDDLEVVYSFCRKFLPILDSVMQTGSRELGIGIKTLVALQVYTEELETIYHNSKVFKTRNCSLIAYPDRDLKPAVQFGNAWVKALPRADLLYELRPYKNYLQTAGLLCADSEREELTQLLWRSGIVRVCPGERMSGTYCGAPHDGDYPLRRYTKTVCVE